MNLLTRTLVLPTAFLALAAIPFAQQRAKKTVATFAETHAEIARAHEAGQFGHAIKAGKSMLTILQEKWKGQILAALPAAPDGYEILPQKKQSRQEAGMMAAMSGAVGTNIEQKYRGDGKTLTVSVQADSPLVQMFGMMVANPAMMGEDAELITYEGGVKAVLKKERSRGHSLQILIGTSLIEAKGDVSDEFLLGMFPQGTVDTLKSIL